MNKLSYALGLSLGQSLVGVGVSDINFDDFLKGIKTMVEMKEPEITPEEGNNILEEYFNKVKKEREIKAKAEADANKVIGEQFLKENKKKEGVITTESGLQYKVLREGTGKQPSVHSQVVCNYEGRFTDGKIFDSSYKESVEVLNESEGKVALKKDGSNPVTFLLNQVIPGWCEGLHLMKEGAEYEFYIPARLAYGETGIPGRIPGNSVLVFTVELIKVL